MPSRIVIAGAGGQVGSFLAAVASGQGRDVLALTSSQWDIADPQRADEIVQAGDVVINCAAYTAVDDAERDRDRAYVLQIAAPDHIARACARVGAQMVHISTDYVFDGSASQPYEPGDDTRPLSVYGQTKLAGELAVLAALPGAVVVRTAWVYTGGDGKDFVAAMRRLAAGDQVVDMVDDQTRLTHLHRRPGRCPARGGRRARARPERHRPRRQCRRGHPLRADPGGVRDPVAPTRSG